MRKQRASVSKESMSMDSDDLGPFTLSDRYFRSIGKPCREITSFYFCDNEKDANECAELVLQKEKRATASSLWWYEVSGETLPKVNDVYIVTDWNGTELCVIQIEKIEITPFNKISQEFAQTEGEGDKSLEYWKKVHWEYYQRELAGSEYEPRQDMLIVCEYFRVIFQ